jgi:fatty-acyl-CoA synthase/long-chain acyl-CoA synthetase
MASRADLTAHELISRACTTYAADPIATFDGETWTYEHAWERGGRLAAALAEKGVEKGDRIGIVMSNQLEYLTANFACIRGGFVNVPLNDMLSRDEFRYMLSDSGASAAIVGESFVDTIAELAADLPELEELIGVSETPPEGMTSLEDALEAANSDAPDVSIDPSDLLRLSYTGGTTGKPKGVKQSHGMIAMDMLAHVIDLDIRHHEEILLMTPLPHSAGYIHLGGLIKGAHLTVTQGFDPAEFLRLVEEEGITWTFLVPTMIYDILDSDALPDADVSGIDTIVYGAAPITSDRLTEALDVFGKVFIQLYAQTEMPDIGTILPKKDHESGGDKITSCGKSASMVDVRIAPTDSTEALDPGESGEVLLRSPYVMDGYHNRPEKTAETVVDGWLRTGDIGKMDEDGYVYLLDRKSDMVISGGMNVYTSEVEDVVTEHPGVNQIAVIGVPHDKWGEAVHAVIIPEDDADIETTAIKKFAADRLSDYKKPKSVEFVEELPTTPYGKVDKKALEKPHWENSDRDIN